MPQQDMEGHVSHDFSILEKNIGIIIVFYAQERARPQLRQGMGADQTRFDALQKRCLQVGVKVTPLRSLVLHGCLQAGNGVTAFTIWKTLLSMVEDRAPRLSSLQRNLTILTQQGILLRDVGPDRVWHYTVAPLPYTGPTVSLIEQGTGHKTVCKAPEIDDCLQRIAVDRGLLIQEASVTLVCRPRSPGNKSRQSA